MTHSKTSNTYQVCKRLADSKSRSQRKADTSYAVRRMKRLRHDFRTGKISAKQWAKDASATQFIIDVLADVGEF